MQVGNQILSDLGGTTSANAQNSTKTSQELQERFMTLLITQIKNQDPLNPLDNAQVTSQLAQLNMVGGIERLNDTIESLAVGFRSAQTLQAAALIGHNVLVEGDALQSTGQGGRFGAELTQPVDELSIRILDPSGNTVERIDLGPQPAGVQGLEWDGTGADGTPLPAGQYRIEMSATNAGQKAAVTTLTSQRVTAVTTQADRMRIELSGIGPVSLDQVRQII